MFVWHFLSDVPSVFFHEKKNCTKFFVQFFFQSIFGLVGLIIIFLYKYFSLVVGKIDNSKAGGVYQYIERVYHLIQI